MSWSKHIQEIINKASKTLNFVRRTLYQCDPLVKTSAYIALVRPILEYASAVWDPHQQYLINNIEMVQRRAARWVKQDYRQTSSVSISFYIKTHLHDINIPRHYLFHCLSYSTRMSHRHRLIPPATSTNYYQKSFFPRTIFDWNNLPNEVIECSSFDEFSYHLKSLCQD